MKSRIVVALIVAVTLSLVGCGSGDSSPTRTVTVVLDWTPNTNHAGVYIAQERGYYEDAGLQVDIIEPDQNGALAQVAVGNAQFGFSAAEQMLPARQRGSMVQSVAAVLQTNTSSLLSPADRDIRRPRDLEGLTYGGFGGDLEQTLVRSLVSCDGGDPNTVTFAEVGNVDYAVGFDRDHYDVVWVFDGWDTIRLRDILGLDVSTIPFRDYTRCIPDWYTPIIVARDEDIAEQPAMVSAFLSATARGYRDFAADPEATAREVASTLPGTDPDLWARSAQFLAPFVLDANGTWGRQSAQTWQRFNAFLTTNDLPTVDDVGAAFTNDFLP